jgi:hypothetical protein
LKAEKAARKHLAALDMPKSTGVDWVPKMGKWEVTCRFNAIGRAADITSGITTNTRRLLWCTAIEIGFVTPNIQYPIDNRPVANRKYTIANKQ